MRPEHPQLRCMHLAQVLSFAPRTQIRCAPLTMLIGRGGAGKTNVLRALDLAAHSASTGICSSSSRGEPFRPPGIVHTRTAEKPGGAPSAMTLEFDTAAGPTTWECALHERLDLVAARTETLGTAQRCTDRATAMALARVRTSYAHRGHPYEAVRVERGAERILNSEEATLELAELVRIWDDGMSVEETIEIALDKSRERHIASVGLERFARTAITLTDPERCAAIGIDLPELGAHPEVVQAIAEAIERASAHATCVIATTHPLMLDAMRDRIEGVIALEPGEENQTMVNPAAAGGAHLAIRDGATPSECWARGMLGAKRW